jgi:ribosomal protein L37AE/L43A
MKYKPTKLPMTQALAEQKEWGWAIVSGFIEGAVAVNEANKGNDFWCCGKCGSPITLRFGAIPKVCSKCGSEFDWVGVKTRIIKICPTCGTQGAIGDYFCPSHSNPSVRLVEKEIPL